MHGMCHPNGEIWGSKSPTFEYQSFPSSLTIAHPTPMNNKHEYTALLLALSIHRYLFEFF